MLDKSVPYYEVWMKRPAGEAVPKIELAEGFRFVSYQAGDEAAWAKIETEVLEFSEEQEALAYFNRVFAPYPEALAQRMFFVEDATGEKVATCTAWWKEINDATIPILHWLAVRPMAQRKGLAGALVAKVTARLAELEPEKDIYLHTQTWSHPAIKLYQKFGYEVIPENLDGSKNEDYEKALAIIEEHN